MIAIKVAAPICVLITPYGLSPLPQQETGDLA